LQQNGLCHRDIKAENFMLANAGDENHIKLIDFGLARWVKNKD
jgi:serine/threonine protein kinase